MKSKSFTVGSKVKLTGKFLRSTGQVTGHAGMDRWIVQACECRNCKEGTWVCTNEPGLTDLYTTEEIAAEPWLSWRHIAVFNLQACK